MQGPVGLSVPGRVGGTVWAVRGADPVSWPRPSAGAEAQACFRWSHRWAKRQGVSWLLKKLPCLLFLSSSPEKFQPKQRSKNARWCFLPGTATERGVAPQRDPTGHPAARTWQPHRGRGSCGGGTGADSGGFQMKELAAVPTRPAAGSPRSCPAWAAGTGAPALLQGSACHHPCTQPCAGADEGQGSPAVTHP